MQKPEKKKKVLILITHFLPGYKSGGPLSTTINTLENLKDFFDFKVLTSDRDMGDSCPYPNIDFDKWLYKENYEVCYLKSTPFIFFKLIKFINASKADVIYINSMFTPVFSIFVLFSNKLGFIKIPKIILSPRGEAFTEALNFKKNKKKLFLALAKLFNLYKKIYWHASTQIEKEAIISQFGIREDRINVALDLTEKPTEEDTFEDEASSSNDNALSIVFLSRISKDKNIVYTFDILKEIKFKIVFDIYGPIEDQYIWDICREKIKEMPQNIKVNYKGFVVKSDVRKTFSKYDLMFLPTFAENFGHVIAESLSVGTPVLISDNTPWRDLEKHDLGWDLALSKPECFVNAITTLGQKSIQERIENRKKIKTSYLSILDYDKIIQDNINLFL